jgi:hypothetical protein
MDISFEPASLVIGVTGHRDLRDEDIPHLKTAVADVFGRLACDYANSRLAADASGQRAHATPMIVLSPLAEGADQLVAQVAVDKGLRVVAPLPLPVEEYRRDFKSDRARPDALKEFDAWMARPGIEKLFVGYENGSSPESVRPLGEGRNLQYRRAGLFVARYCDILMALWDGKTGMAMGGTAEIVDFKRHGVLPHGSGSGSGRADLDASATGPVIHIVTPRATKSDAASVVSVNRWGTELVERFESLDAAAKQPSLGAAEKQIMENEMAAIESDYRRWKSFEASGRRAGEGRNSV